MDDNRGPLVEPAMIPDIFVSGVARIEVLDGGLVRWTHYVTQYPLDEDGGSPLRVIVSRLVMPIDAVPGGMDRIRAAFGDVLVDPTGETAGVALH